MCRGNTSIATFTCEINKLVEMRVEVFRCFFFCRKHFAGILRIETSPTILTFLRLRFAISTDYLHSIWSHKWSYLNPCVRTFFSQLQDGYYWSESNHSFYRCPWLKSPPSQLWGHRWKVFRTIFRWIYKP